MFNYLGGYCTSGRAGCRGQEVNLPGYGGVVAQQPGLLAAQGVVEEVAHQRPDRLLGLRLDRIAGQSGADEGEQVVADMVGVLNGDGPGRSGTAVVELLLKPGILDRALVLGLFPFTGLGDVSGVIGGQDIEAGGRHAGVADRSKVGSVHVDPSVEARVIGQDLLRTGAPEGETHSTHRVEVESMMERATGIRIARREMVQDEGEIRGVGGGPTGRPFEPALEPARLGNRGLTRVTVDLAATAQGDRGTGGVGVVHSDDDVTLTGQVHHE